MTTFEMEVGALWWHQIRDLVSRAQFDGHEVSLWESSGWLSRTFVIKGDAKIVKAIADAMEDVQDKLAEKREKS